MRGGGDLLDTSEAISAARDFFFFFFFSFFFFCCWSKGKDASLVEFLSFFLS
jgi:hypothetical protein